MQRVRYVVLGIDGATWRNLRPWAEAGFLPHLRALMQEGAWGSLRSVIPPVTAPAWVSFMTGKGPGKHGVYDFVKPVDGTLLGFDVISSHDVREPTLWSIAGDQGRKVIVFNVPVTYPPKPVNGLLVGDMLTPSIECDFTYPKEIREELLREVGDYTITINWLEYKKHESRRLLRDLSECLEQRRKTIRFLMQSIDWDLFVGVLTETDRLQHALWNEIEPGVGTQGAGTPREILDFYRQVDDIVGEVRAAAGEGSYLFLISDHGFGPLRRKFHTNNWLIQQGYLRIRPAKQFLLKGVSLCRRAILKLARVLRRSRVPRRSATGPAQRSIAAPWGVMKIMENCVDWRGTRAFARSFTQNGIHINLIDREPNGCVTAGDLPRLRDEILAKLRELTDTAHSETVVEQVFSREELYTGPQSANAPDIIFRTKDGYQTDPFIGGSLFDDANDKSGTGMHTEDGIFLVSGPGIRQGARIAPAHITDVAPTVLYTMGYPAPSDMDGAVIAEAFEASFLSERHPEQVEVEQVSAHSDGTAFTDQESDLLKDRLRGLGYLG